MDNGERIKVNMMMNGNNYLILNKINEEAIKREVDLAVKKSEEQQKIYDYSKKAQEAFYSPTRNKIFFGATEKKTPTWAVWVKDLDKERKYREIANKTGDLSMEDKAKYDPYAPEFQESAKEFWDLESKIDKGEITVKQAGSMTQSDFVGMRLVELLGGLINQERRDYSLSQAVRVWNTEELMLRIPTVSRFTIASELGEYDLAESMKMAFTSQMIQLKKDVAHLAYSDEFMMARYDQPIMNLSMDNARTEFDRVKAKKVAVQVLRWTNGDTLSNGWDEYESSLDRSKVNPAINFHTARMAIRAGYGRMTRVASNSLTLQIYLGNTHVNGQLQPTEGQDVGAYIVSPVPRQPGLIWYVDEELADGQVALWDDSAMAFIQGPVRSSTYRDEHAGGNGLYIRDWNGCFALRLAQGYVYSGAT
jgi:hypothetical protein